MRGSVRIGRLFGIPLFVNWSAPVLVVLLMYVLGGEVLPSELPGRSSSTYALAGVVGGLALLGSLLLHEATHAVVARGFGIRVEDITLWALGGVARIDQPTTAWQELWIAVSGPAMSLFLGGSMLGIVAATGTGTPATAVVGWIGAVNLVLGIFNLLPGAPLDGGRVLQAILWRHWRDRERSVIAAGRAGQAVGMALLAIGFLEVVSGYSAGLWTVLVGGFLMLTATAESRQAALGVAVGETLVREVMSSPVEAGPDWLSVQDFLTAVAVRSHHEALALLDWGGRPSGLVFVRRLLAVPPRRRTTLRARELAVPLPACVVAEPDERVRDVLARAAARPACRGRVLVVEDGFLVGILTSSDVGLLLRRRSLTTAGPTLLPR